MSMIQAGTSNFGGLMAVRFLLGIFEAAFQPGVALYMSFFYHRSEMTLRYGIWISVSALASCFASALAYGLVQAKTAVAGWQLLYLVEGSPTLVIAIIAYIFLPNSPSECRFLSTRENEIVASRAIQGRGDGTEKRLNFRQIFAAFYDYKNYLQAAMIFCVNNALVAYPLFFPRSLRTSV